MSPLGHAASAKRNLRGFAAVFAIAMIPRPFHPLVCALTATFALLAGSACAQSSKSATPPPEDPSEATVRSADERAAAALTVSAAQIRPGETVNVQVANRGEVAVNHGRPLVVEHWTGTAWEETTDSRNTAWTMELLHVEPGRSGLEQPWPFQSGQKPPPGWYRFTKDLHPSESGSAPKPLVVRTRVEVVQP